MAMKPSLRKFMLAAHIATSVGVLGSIAAFLALALAGLTIEGSDAIRAAYLAMDLIASFVIVPLMFASLLTGAIQSLGTPWGLFRHYWIVAKLLLTSIATAVLLAKLELIDFAARLAAEAILRRAELHAAGMELGVHAAGGLLVLLAPTLLSIYKPRGLTPYGRQRLQERRSVSQRPAIGPQRPVVGALDGVGIGVRDGVLTITLRRGYLVGIVGFVLLLHLALLHFAGVGH